MTIIKAPFPSPVSWHNAPYPAISPNLPSLSAANKTIAVTGAGSGIGFNIARAFAQAGAAKLVLLGRTSSTLLSAKSSIEILYPTVKVFVFVADVTNEASVVSAFGGIKEEVGEVNVLVSNAGYLPDILSTKDISVKEWWRGYEVNVLGTFIGKLSSLKSK